MRTGMELRRLRVLALPAATSLPRWIYQRFLTVRGERGKQTPIFRTISK
jgi:hypothetical protein